MIIAAGSRDEGLRLKERLGSWETVWALQQTFGYISCVALRRQASVLRREPKKGLTHLFITYRRIELLTGTRLSIYCRPHGPFKAGLLGALCM